MSPSGPSAVVWPLVPKRLREEGAVRVTGWSPQQVSSQMFMDRKMDLVMNQRVNRRYRSPFLWAEMGDWTVTPITASSGKFFGFLRVGSYLTEEQHLNDCSPSALIF